MANFIFLGEKKLNILKQYSEELIFDDFNEAEKEMISDILKSACNVVWPHVSSPVDFEIRTGIYVKRLLRKNEQIPYYEYSVAARHSGCNGAVFHCRIDHLDYVEPRCLVDLFIKEGTWIIDLKKKALEHTSSKFTD